jgi:hypothetical protein
MQISKGFFRSALLIAGLTVAAPSFASVLTPLCGGEKGEHGDTQDKNKSENKKEKEQPKKPTNPS